EPGAACAGCLALGQRRRRGAEARVERAVDTGVFAPGRVEFAASRWRCVAGGEQSLGVGGDLGRLPDARRRLDFALRAFAVEAGEYRVAGGAERAPLALVGSTPAFAERGPLLLQFAHTARRVAIVNEGGGAIDQALFRRLDFLFVCADTRRQRVDRRL